MMKRRDVLKSLAFAGGAMLAKADDVKDDVKEGARDGSSAIWTSDSTDTQAGVTKKYFDVYFLIRWR